MLLMSYNEGVATSDVGRVIVRANIPESTLTVIRKSDNKVLLVEEDFNFSLQSFQTEVNFHKSFHNPSHE